MSGAEQRSGERRAAATGHWLRPAVFVAVEALHLPGREPGADGLERAAAASLEARHLIAQRVSEGGGRLIASLQDCHVGVWGLPTARSGDWRRAREAALRLHGELAPGLLVRSAIAGGTVLAGAGPGGETWSPALAEAVRGLDRPGDDGPAGFDALADRLEDELEAMARLDALGAAAEIVRELAALGPDAPAALLARVTGARKGAVARTLAMLARQGVLRLERRRGQIVAAITDDALAATALHSVPVSRRRELNGEAAAALADRADEASPEDARAVARHADGAGDGRRSFVWWRRAASAALERGQFENAIRDFTSALSTSRRDPSAAAVREEIDVLRDLANALGAARGNAAPAAVQAYRKGVAMCERLEPDGLGLSFDFLWGLVTSHMVRGEVDNAAWIGRRLKVVADSEGRDDRLVVAHRVLGLATLLGGRLDDAVDHYQRVLALYRAERHAELRFQFSSDQRAVALAGLAWAHTVSARPAEARLRAAEAREDVRRLDHVHTRVHVNGVLAAAAQLEGDRDVARALADETRRDAVAHSLPYWEAWAQILLGSLDADAETGGANIDTAISRYRVTGARQVLPYAYILLSGCHLRAGNVEAAAVAAEDAARARMPGGVRLFDAEIDRQRALVAQQSGAARGPETKWRQLLRRAYDTAVAQGAELFARRAAGTLVELEAGSAGSLAHMKLVVRNERRFH